MKTVAVVQARMNSTRLPGKVMLPLGEQYVLYHVIRRIQSVDGIDQVVVATSELEADDVIAYYATQCDAEVYRGPHQDVLTRIFNAAQTHDADVIIRLSADNPLIFRRYTEHMVSRITTGEFDYVTASVNRTFPPGLTNEAFTFSSFATVNRQATTSEQREHVTQYYRQNLSEFSYENIRAEDVEGADIVAGRTDLRLTLDRAADYDRLRRLYEHVEYDELLPVADAIDYLENELCV